MTSNLQIGDKVKNITYGWEGIITMTRFDELAPYFVKYERSTFWEDADTIIKMEQPHDQQS